MYLSGEKIKELRKRRGLTQQAVADRIGKSRSAVISYETGRQTPPMDVIISIAQLFRVKVDALLSDDEADRYDGFTEEQAAFLFRLQEAFLSPASAAEGLSPGQAALVKELIDLFNKGNSAE